MNYPTSFSAFKAELALENRSNEKSVFKRKILEPDSDDDEDLQVLKEKPAQRKYTAVKSGGLPSQRNGEKRLDTTSESLPTAVKTGAMIGEIANAAEDDDDDIVFIREVGPTFKQPTRRGMRNKPDEGSDDEYEASIGEGYEIADILDFELVQNELYFLVQYMGYSPCESVWTRDDMIKNARLKNRFAEAIESELKGGPKHRPYVLEMPNLAWKNHALAKELWARSEEKSNLKVPGRNGYEEALKRNPSLTTDLTEFA